MREYHQGHMSKEELENNALLSFLVRLRHFVIKNKRIVVLAGLGVLLLLIVAGFMAVNSAAREEKAAAEFDKVAVMLQGEGAREKIGDIDKQLDTIIKTWPGTLAAAKASLHLADIQYRMDNFAGAIENFTRVKDHGKSSYLYPAALIGIANCYEQSGEPAKAVDYYDAVGALSDHFGLKDMALLGKARVLGAQGKFDEARKVLENIRSDVSAFADEAMRLSIWLDSKKTVQVLPAGK